MSYQEKENTTSTPVNRRSTYFPYQTYSGGVIRKLFSTIKRENSSPFMEEYLEYLEGKNEEDETIVYEAITALWEAIASQQEQLNTLKEDVKKLKKDTNKRVVYLRPPKK